MDFLRQAKKGIKDAQDISKMLGIDKMNIKDKLSGKYSQSASTSTAPTASSSAGTPAASASPAALTTPAVAASASAAPTGAPNLTVAPSSNPDAPKKLHMVARKSIRDDFENKKPELEEKLSKLLGGVKWTIFVDAANVYSYSKDTDSTYASEQPGRMWFEYFESAIRRMESWIQKAGPDAVEQVNRLASSHTMTMEPQPEASNARYCSGDIADGKLRVLFKVQGTNVNNAFDDIAAFVSAAGIAASAGSGAGPALSLAARTDIRNKYEPGMVEVEAKSRKQVAMPTLTFVPNFEDSYAKLYTHIKSLDEEDRKHPLSDDFDTNLGQATLSYFEGLARWLDSRNFRKDDMMQEAFKDAVDKGEVVLRIDESIPKGKRNDVIIEEGRVIIRTRLTEWWVNTSNATEGLVDLL